MIVNISAVKNRILTSAEVPAKTVSGGRMNGNLKGNTYCAVIDTCAKLV